MCIYINTEYWPEYSFKKVNFQIMELRDTAKKTFEDNFIKPRQFCSKNSKQIPANIYLFKINNKNTRKRCEIC